MPKPRQAQKKPDGTTAIPKPSCKNHTNPETGEIEPVIMDRLYIQKKKASTGKRGLIKWGWGCPVCGEGKKDKEESE